MNEFRAAGIVENKPFRNGWGRVHSRSIFHIFFIIKVPYSNMSTNCSVPQFVLGLHHAGEDLNNGSFGQSNVASSVNFVVQVSSAVTKLNTTPI
jgi:hypothetical protein